MNTIMIKIILKIIITNEIIKINFKTDLNKINFNWIRYEPIKMIDALLRKDQAWALEAWLMLTLVN